MKPGIVILLVILAWTGKSYSQTPNILIGEPSGWPSEPSVCLNPANAWDLPSGVYCYHLRTGSKVLTRKTVYLRD